MGARRVWISFEVAITTSAPQVVKTISAHAPHWGFTVFLLFTVPAHLSAPSFLLLPLTTSWFLTSSNKPVSSFPSSILSFLSSPLGLTLLGVVLFLLFWTGIQCQILGKWLLTYKQAAGMSLSAGLVVAAGTHGLVQWVHDWLGVDENPTVGAKSRTWSVREAVANKANNLLESLSSWVQQYSYFCFLVSILATIAIFTWVQQLMFYSHFS